MVVNPLILKNKVTSLKKIHEHKPNTKIKSMLKDNVETLLVKR